MLDLEKIRRQRSYAPNIVDGVPHVNFPLREIDKMITEIERLQAERGVPGTGTHTDVAELADAPDHGIAAAYEALPPLWALADEARESARRLREQCDRREEAAHVLMAEFAKADDQRIAVCEELARVRKDRDRWKKEAAWTRGEYNKCRTELERLRTAIAAIVVPDND